MYVLPLPPAQARSLLNAAATQKYYCVNMLFFIYLFVFFFFSSARCAVLFAARMSPGIAGPVCWT